MKVLLASGLVIALLCASPAWSQDPRSNQQIIKDIQDGKRLPTLPAPPSAAAPNVGGGAAQERAAERAIDSINRQESLRLNEQLLERIK